MWGWEVLTLSMLKMREGGATLKFASSPRNRTLRILASNEAISCSDPKTHHPPTHFLRFFSGFFSGSFFGVLLGFFGGFLRLDPPPSLTPPSPAHPPRCQCSEFLFQHLQQGGSHIPQAEREGSHHTAPVREDFQLPTWRLKNCTDELSAIRFGVQKTEVHLKDAQDTTWQYVSQSENLYGIIY